MRNERRKHFDPIRHEQPTAVLGNCKWAMRDGYVEAYCKAMGWTLLHEESDGGLWMAPAGFMDDVASRHVK